jgi:hypothetical protein
MGKTAVMTLFGNASKLKLPKCRHRYTWVVSYAEQGVATEAVQYLKYQQCRRCGEYLQRVA